MCRKLFEANGAEEEHVALKVAAVGARFLPIFVNVEGGLRFAGTWP